MEFRFWWRISSGRRISRSDPGSRLQAPGSRLQAPGSFVWSRLIPEPGARSPISLLARVGLTAQDRERAVDLLEQDQARQAVRQRHRRQAEAERGARRELAREPLRAANRERDVALAL